MCYWYVYIVFLNELSTPVPLLLLFDLLRVHVWVYEYVQVCVCWVYTCDCMIFTLALLMNWISQMSVFLYCMLLLYGRVYCMWMHECAYLWLCVCVYLRQQLSKISSLLLCINVCQVWLSGLYSQYINPLRHMTNPSLFLEHCCSVFIIFITLELKPSPTHKIFLIYNRCNFNCFKMCLRINILISKCPFLHLILAFKNSRK